MTKKTFSKPALSLEQQILFLANQGLIIQHADKAKHALATIGYYRLSGYMLPFKLPHQDNSPRQFKPGIKFEHIWQLYQFDQQLKLLVIEAIEKIEIAFRAALCNTSTTLQDPFWYTKREYYHKTIPYEGLMHEIKKITKNKHEIFLEHYYQHYDAPAFPPLWMMLETLSFGTCSKLFANLKHVGHKKQICQLFDCAPTLMDSWLKTLVYVRNLCAHHARLWNRWLVEAPIIPKTERFYEGLRAQNRRFIACAYIIIRLLQAIAPSWTWQQQLYELFSKYPDYPGPAMGFSVDWENDAFWRLSFKEIHSAY